MMVRSSSSGKSASVVRSGSAAIAFCFCFFCPLEADEGMWLFNRLPTAQLEKKHGFALDPESAEHVMRSCARISSGGSGSIVSERGLIFTNHHVVSRFLQELSTPEKNYLEDGFQARSLERELRCPNVVVLVLWEIDDVTRRVKSAVTPEMEPGAAEKARRAEIAVIEKESKEKTGLHSEVVTLYRGGEFHLYRYRRYDDVRLVMAPEVDIAFFGGDADNFEFPRFCFDVAFLRLYEDGKPARMKHHLRWSSRGARKGELVLVAGNPGSTQRLNTVDHLRFLRDVRYPGFLEMLYRREILLQQFSLRGPEPRRLARDDLFRVQNSRKALRGILTGLLDPAVFEAKLRAEAALRSMVASDPSLGASVEDWSRIASAMTGFRDIYDEYSFLERGRAFWSDLYGKARIVVRLVEEKEKPDTERLPEYRDSVFKRVEMRLYSPAPIDASLEVAKLTDSLTAFSEAFGADHPLVRTVLVGRSPTDRAYRLVSGTSLMDVEKRRELVESGRDGVARSEDPMVQLARTVDPYARGVRTKYDSLVKGVQTEAYGRISRSAFAVTGTSVYPDATFTLRLAYGVVKGWEEEGRKIEPFTRLDGAYRLSKQHGGEDPYAMPESWRKSRDALSLSTHLNFVSTADIIGGNSGSPVINRAAEVVGIIFDGNIHSLVLDVVYTEEKARAVSVSAEAVVEALGVVYGMDGLVREILGH